MTTKTAKEPPSAPAPSGFGWCAWHKQYARGVRLIQVQEQGSGSGGSRFACASCREKHHLVPLADRS